MRRLLVSAAALLTIAGCGADPNFDDEGPYDGPAADTAYGHAWNDGHRYGARAVPDVDGSQLTAAARRQAIASACDRGMSADWTRGCVNGALTEWRANGWQPAS